MAQPGKPMPLALKLALFIAFVGVWGGLTFLLHRESMFFKEGGWGMWPILAAGLVFVIITVDRTYYLFFAAKSDSPKLLSTVRRMLLAGNVNGAISACQTDGAPLAKIVSSGLENLQLPDDEVQEAIDETALYEMPRIERRTGYLAMIGNIATLLGLLGTIVGLITSFAGVSLENEDDPDTQVRAAAYVNLVPMCVPLLEKKRALVACIKQNKATVLARGISEAMHCTAFGLLVGILSLLAFSVLNGRTQGMIDDINDGTIRVMNFAIQHRTQMKLGPEDSNIPAPT